MGVAKRGSQAQVREAELKDRFGDEYGLPASKRSSDPYKKRNKRWEKPAFVKDAFGIVDSFTSNRRERRARKHAH